MTKHSFEDVLAFAKYSPPCSSKLDTRQPFLINTEEGEDSIFCGSTTIECQYREKQEREIYIKGARVLLHQCFHGAIRSGLTVISPDLHQIRLRPDSKVK